MEMAVKEIAQRLNRVGCDLEELQPQEIPEPSVCLAGIKTIQPIQQFESLFEEMERRSALKNATMEILLVEMAEKVTALLLSQAGYDLEAVQLQKMSATFELLDGIKIVQQIQKPELQDVEMDLG